MQIKCTLGSSSAFIIALPALRCIPSKNYFKWPPAKNWVWKPVFKRNSDVALFYVEFVGTRKIWQVLNESKCCELYTQENIFFCCKKTEIQINTCVHLCIYVVHVCMNVQKKMKKKKKTLVFVLHFLILQNGGWNSNKWFHFV